MLLIFSCDTFAFATQLSYSNNDAIIQLLCDSMQHLMRGWHIMTKIKPKTLDISE